MSTSAHASHGPGRIVGRYALHDPIAAGGMAIVHLGRLLGEVGFSRTVAIKRVHPNFVHDREFIAMFVDEARLAARIHHPNVVPTLDVVVDRDEVLLVMEYVHGESLSRLVRRASDTGPIALRACSTILTGILHGLHAAHEAKDEQGRPLGIVHRDVSPQNLLVGADGIPRILDFGVAKAAGRMQTTRDGRIKGKLAYMAPEQLSSMPATRKSDVYAASVVAWELVTGTRLFYEPNEGATVRRIMDGAVDPPSKWNPNVPPELDAIILKGLSRDPDARFATAREMALTLEATVAPALASEVATIVHELAGDTLEERRQMVAVMEASGEGTLRSASRSVEGLLRSTEDETRSQLAVRSEPNRKSQPRWRGPALGAAALALVGLAAVPLISAGRRSPAPSASSLPVATASPSPVSSAPSAEAKPPATSSTSPEAGAPGPAVSSTAKPPVHAPSRVARPGASKPSCDPPYTVDPIGRKIYKRECF